MRIVRRASETLRRPDPQLRLGALPRGRGVALRTSAFATSAAFQLRWVAHTIAAAAVTSGAENDVPEGV